MPRIMVKVLVIVSGEENELYHLNGILMSGSPASCFKTSCRI